MRCRIRLGVLVVLGSLFLVSGFHDAEVHAEGKKGWHYDKGWYYYDDSLTLALGWRQVGSYWYYFDPSQNGRMISGTHQIINGKEYAFKSDGAMITGWEYQGGSWYYYGTWGKIAGWQRVGGYWYFLDPLQNGRMLSNTRQVINGKEYVFKSDGAMLTGWEYQSGSWYYYGTWGKVTGWQQVGSYWYYFEPSQSGKMLSNTHQVINGKEYAFCSSGKMIIGWEYRNRSWYYYGGWGKISGWQKIGGYWYYLDPAKSGKMFSGGWKRISGKWYYLGTSGAMATDWLYKGGWYYFGMDGAMRTGWHVIDGLRYYFYKEKDSYGGSWGMMAKNTIIEGNRLSSDGSDITAQYILNQIRGTTSVTAWNTNVTSQQKAGINNAIAAFHNRGWDVGFVMIDINTGKAVSYNAGLELAGASTVKGPYVLSLLSAGYNDNDNMWQAVKRSSNSAYTNLRSKYGSSVYKNWLVKAAVSSSRGNAVWPDTTSLELAKMWLYSYRYLISGQANAGWARSAFQYVDNSPISSKLSGKYTVYSKPGWMDRTEGDWTNVYHDAAIVTDGKNPYIITIVSSSPGADRGRSCMEGLAGQLDIVHRAMVQ